MSSDASSNTSLKRKPRTKHEVSTIIISDDEKDEEKTISPPKKRKLSEEVPDKKKVVPTHKGMKPQWTEYELLAQQQNLNPHVAQHLIALFEEGNTIPFIARYRRDLTNNMSPETLREAKETYEEIGILKHKMALVVKNLEKAQVLTEPLKNKVTASRSIEELEYLYAPYKPGGKHTLAERARDLGLEVPAISILKNNNTVNLGEYIQNDKKDISCVENIEKGIIHVIASIIATDTDTLSYLRELRTRTKFVLTTKKTAPSKTKQVKTDKKIDESKFENYENFEMPIVHIKPHQILAINRGEALKVLNVKITTPDNILQIFTDFCERKWMNFGQFNAQREKIIKLAIQDAYNRLVHPLMIREIRAELKNKAERASCEVFSTNLKHLLLSPPFKGKAILGMDPGFSNGCKIALVSALGKLLAHATIYPLKKNSQKEKDARILKDMLLEHNCEVIALGNGTGCRQTEEWLTYLIKHDKFRPLHVKYTIVSENGASIYSCSPEAKKEFPNLDPNIISAISLGRRIQDPLAELVKVEPKHLGVGMYQHDLKKKQLEDALNEVISECVSFVGVDLNTTSQCLLRHVAGISDKRALQIIQHRDKNGPFICRNQLLDVFGIGPRLYKQCAGFLRVGPVRARDESTFYKNTKTEKLDRTYIHPESYDLAKRIVIKFKLKLNDIGRLEFIETVKKRISSLDIVKLSEELNSKEQTVNLILDTLSKPLNHDFRSEMPREPLFKKGLASIHDLHCGIELTGRVTNVTHFGCFVDIGVGTSGLIHVSNYNGLDLQIGDKVKVVVFRIDIEKKRISLKAVKKL